MKASAGCVIITLNISCEEMPRHGKQESIAALAVWRSRGRGESPAGQAGTETARLLLAVNASASQRLGRIQPKKAVKAKKGAMPGQRSRPTKWRNTAGNSRPAACHYP